MRSATIAVLVVAALSLALSCPQASDAARAVICGKKPPKGKTQRAELSLDPAASFTDLKFKRDTQPDFVALTFHVAGCRLRKNLAKPTITIFGGSKPSLSQDAIQDVVADGDGQTLRLKISIDPTKMKIASYDATLIAKARYINSTTIRITASRSEPNWKIPLGVILIGGVAGVFWVIVGALRGLTGPARISLYWGGIVVLVGLVTSLLTLWSVYFPEEVWNGDDYKNTGVAAFTAASAGAVTGLIGKAVFQQAATSRKQGARRRRRRRKSQSPVQEKQA